VQGRPGRSSLVGGSIVVAGDPQPPRCHRIGPLERVLDRSVCGPGVVCPLLWITRAAPDLVGKAGFEPAASASRTLKYVLSTPLRTQKPQVTTEVRARQDPPGRPEDMLNGCLMTGRRQPREPGTAARPGRSRGKHRARPRDLFRRCQGWQAGRVRPRYHERPRAFRGPIRNFLLVVSMSV
jgi:hypothetical protein